MEAMSAETASRMSSVGDVDWAWRRVSTVRSGVSVIVVVIMVEAEKWTVPLSNEEGVVRGEEMAELDLGEVSIASKATAAGMVSACV